MCDAELVKQVGTDRNDVKFWMVLTRKITYKEKIYLFTVSCATI